MATLKGLSRSKRSEALSKGIVVDTVRGVLRVRKWPRKRGTPKSALQRWWNDWFRQANKLAKYASGYDQARAIEITKDSGMYPRDVMLAAMRGRLYIWQDQTGKVWYPMAAIQDISESLDVLAQDIGSVLVRAADRWRAPPPGVVGQALLYQGPADPPSWGSVGGGMAQTAIAGTPISPDGTKNKYILPVTTDFSVDLVLHDIGFSSADQPRLRYSTDGGLTYHSGASDYSQAYVRASSNGSGHYAQVYTTDGNKASGIHCKISISSLRAGRAVHSSMSSTGSSNAIARTGFAHFDGPVTHIELSSIGGNNFNAGDIFAVGIRPV